MSAAAASAGLAHFHAGRIVLRAFAGARVQYVVSLAGGLELIVETPTSGAPPASTSARTVGLSLDPAAVCRRAGMSGACVQTSAPVPRASGLLVAAAAGARARLHGAGADDGAPQLPAIPARHGHRRPTGRSLNYTQIVTDPYYLEIVGRTLAPRRRTSRCDAHDRLPARLFPRADASPLARHGLTLLVIFPLLLNLVVRSFGWMALLANRGLVNNAADGPRA